MMLSSMREKSPGNKHENMVDYTWESYVHGACVAVHGVPLSLCYATVGSLYAAVWYLLAPPYYALEAMVLVEDTSVKQHATI